jgi:hypothetical protein
MRAGRHSTGSRLSAGLVAGTLLIGQPPAGPSAQQVGPNINISRVKGNQNETAVAINPTNPDNIVVTSNLDSFQGLFKAYSLDGGLTWASEIIADGDGLGLSCCDSSLAFDSYGNLFLTYLQYVGPDLPVAISTDEGATFQLLDRILPRLVGGPDLPGRSRVSIPDQPTIATGPGSVWVTFTGGTVVEAAGAAVTGFGDVGRFNDPEVAVGQRGGHFGDIAIGPDGQVLVVYQTPSGQGRSKIITDLDPDGLGPAGFDPTRLVAITNVGDYDAIPAAARVTIDSETGLAWDRSGGPHDGRVYLLWTQERHDESDDTNILVQYSNDDGATWADPVRVNDDSGVNSQFDPKVALDETTGNVAVAWYDCRNDLGSGGRGDTNGVANDDAMFYGSFSTDGGVTFARNFNVASAVSNSEDAGTQQDFGDYEALAFEAGSFYPVWADNSNSTGDNPDGTLQKLDLYTARATVS